MYTISELCQMCILCLTNNKNLINIVSHDVDKVRVEEKLKYVLVELVKTEPEISKHICYHCLDNLNYVYSFKQRCLENISTFNSYLETFQNKESGRNTQLTRIDINESYSEPTRTNNINFEKVIIKRDITEDEAIKEYDLKLTKHRKTTEINKNEEVLGKEDNFGKTEYKEIYDNEDNKKQNDDAKYEIEDIFIKEEPEEDNVDVDIKAELDKFESERLNNADSLESRPSTPPQLRDQVKNLSLALLPEKSKTRYERCYQVFVRWCEDKNVKTYTENVLLAYFIDLASQNKKSFWAIFSMLKCCIMIHKNTDISKYTKLLAYLKRKTVNVKPKTSRVLEEGHIATFIEQAPDYEYLMLKVVLIMGVSGGLRREELYKMLVEDVEVKNDIIMISVPESSSNSCRQFVITNNKWIALVKKYLEIRLGASRIKDRFFLKYSKGQCINSPVGINTIGGMPSKIAEFLHLDNFREYTGHCFRRSSASLLAKRAGDLLDLTLKRHGLWKGDEDNSLKRKTQEVNEGGPSTSKLVYTHSVFGNKYH